MITAKYASPTPITSGFATCGSDVCMSPRANKPTLMLTLGLSLLGSDLAGQLPDPVDVALAQGLSIERDGIRDRKHYYRKEPDTVDHNGSTMWKAKPQSTRDCFLRERQSQAETAGKHDEYERKRDLELADPGATARCTKRHDRTKCARYSEREKPWGP